MSNPQYRLEQAYLNVTAMIAWPIHGFEAKHHHRHDTKDRVPIIHGLAMQSLMSHLNKLAQDGTVDCSHGLWRLSH